MTDNGIAPRLPNQPQPQSWHSAYRDGQPATEGKFAIHRAY